MEKKTFGIERERFILNAQNQIVPEIGKLLPLVQKIARERDVSMDRFTYELFAGQIEDRTPPCCDLFSLRDSLVVNDNILNLAINKLNLSFDYSEFVDVEKIASFDVNPFDERHKKIWASIPEERRMSASVVAAVHVHISVNEDDAVQLLNLCRKDVVDHLISLGDHSCFKRINAYRIMAETDGVPPLFSNFSEVMNYITLSGGEKNIWDLVRYKPSTGTVEFRMFGTTPNVDEIIGYVNACLSVSKI